MFNILGDINWLAVLLSTIAYLALGGVWYTFLFRSPYATALGKEATAKPNMSPIFYLGPLVCSLVTSFASAVLMRALGVDGIGDALLFGTIVGLGYLVATTFNVAINPNMPRPLLYGLVSGGYFLLGSVISSLILVALA